MAVNTLAIKPIVRVMANPRIGPVPNKNRKNAETTVEGPEDGWRGEVSLHGIRAQ